MSSVRRYRLVLPLALLTALIGCDRSQPLDPGASMDPGTPVAFRVTEAPSGTSAVPAPVAQPMRVVP